MHSTECLATPRTGHRAKRLSAAARLLLVVSPGVGITACGPSQDQIRLGRAMYLVRHEVYPDYRDGLAILAKVRDDPKHKNEFVQYGMCTTTLAFLGGNLALADEVAKHTHLAVCRYQDADREGLAAIGAEAIKFFKGEPHERALLAFYAGLVCYMNGGYNDARIFFMQSLFASATRDEDMREFRDDFRLGHFWLGRAFLKLGQEDNARVAFQKAGVRLFHKGEQREIKRLKDGRKKAYQRELKGEALCYEKGTKGKHPVARIVDISKSVGRSQMPGVLPDAGAADPTELAAATLDVFLGSDFQRSVNLIIVVELGRGPVKYLTGLSQSIDDYRRSEYKEKAVDIYVDGHRSGPAFRLLDTYHQAVTRGVKTRRGRQVGKVIAKEILKRTPFVGMIAGYWDISADARFWPSLAGEIHVYAARVTPGLRDIALRFYDINDRYLPRFDLSRYYIHVPDEGEVVLLLHSVENHDNAYMLAHAAPQ